MEKGRKIFFFGPKLQYFGHNSAIFGARTGLKPVLERAGPDPGLGGPEMANKLTFFQGQGGLFFGKCHFFPKLG